MSPPESLPFTHVTLFGPSLTSLLRLSDPGLVTPRTGLEWEGLEADRLGRSPGQDCREYPVIVQPRGGRYLRHTTPDPRTGDTVGVTNAVRGRQGVDGCPDDVVHHSGTPSQK